MNIEQSAAAIPAEAATYVCVNVRLFSLPICLFLILPISSSRPFAAEKKIHGRKIVILSWKKWY